MRNFKLFFVFALTVIGCVEHVGSDQTKKWTTDEIVVTIDDSVPAGIAAMVEESFYMWLDLADSEIVVDFHYGPCVLIAGNSCVTMSNSLSGAYGHTDIHYRGGEIYSTHVYLLDSIDGDALQWTINHEIAHAMGVQHTENTEDVMYPYFFVDKTEIQSTPSAGDIESIKGLY